VLSGPAFQENVTFSVHVLASFFSFFSTQNDKLFCGSTKRKCTERVSSSWKNAPDTGTKKKSQSIYFVKLFSGPGFQENVTFSVQFLDVFSGLKMAKVFVGSNKEYVRKEKKKSKYILRELFRASFSGQCYIFWNLFFSVLKMQENVTFSVHVLESFFFSTQNGKSFWGFQTKKMYGKRKKSQSIYFVNFSG